jgi:hypothetical protein
MNHLSVSELLQQLRTTKSSRHRAPIARELGQHGPKAATAIPDLIDAFKHEENVCDNVPWAAREALMQIGAAAVPALIAGLKNEAVVVRELSAATLGGLGATAQEAVPGLIAALDDPEESVREAARRALAAIDPQASAPPSRKGNQTS